MRESAFRSTVFVGVPRVSPDQGSTGVCNFIVSFWGSRVFVRSSGLVQVILSLGELTHALEDDVKERLPKTLNRFVFNRTFPSMLREVRDHDPPETTRTEDKDAIAARGRILWNSVYDPYANKLHDKLSSYHPDFMGEYTRAHVTTFSTPPLCFIPYPSFVRDHSNQEQRSVPHTSHLRQRPTAR